MEVYGPGVNLIRGDNEIDHRGRDSVTCGHLRPGFCRHLGSAVNDSHQLCSVDLRPAFAEERSAAGKPGPRETVPRDEWEWLLLNASEDSPPEAFLRLLIGLCGIALVGRRLAGKRCSVWRVLSGRIFGFQTMIFA
jgi:hypothetical protein